MIVAFFDFDGTVTKKDSFLDFVAFTHGRLKLKTSFILYIYHIIGYKLNLVSGKKIKEMFLSHYYKGMSDAEFKALGIEYCKTKVSEIIRPNAIKRIQWHQNKGHKIVIVTASISQWIKPWCDKLGIDLISTEIEVVNKKITGKLWGENCKGPEKVTRIHKEYNLQEITYSYAYGNSNGDKELLEIADEKYYRYF